MNEAAVRLAKIEAAARSQQLIGYPKLELLERAAYFTFSWKAASIDVGRMVGELDCNVATYADGSQLAWNADAGIFASGELDGSRCRVLPFENQRKGRNYGSN